MIDMCSLIARSGDEVTALATDPKDAPDAWKAASPPPGTPKLVDIGRPAGRLGRFSSAQIARVRDLISRHDVVHIHSMWTPSNIQIAALCRSLGVQYVLSVHGMLDDWSMAQSRAKKRVFLLLGGNAMLRGAASVHFTAQAELDQGVKWIGSGAARGVVVPLLFDLAPFGRLPGPELARERFADAFAGASKTFLFLSRLHYKKGPDALIRAAIQLRASRPDARILIAGSGEPAYEKELADLAHGLGVDGFVRFLGFVSGDLKLSLYQAADVFVLPTSQENFGYVFFEALACGTPVLTTRGVDTWPEIEASGGGRIIDFPTVGDEGLARALNDIAGLELSTMGQAGRDWVFANLSERVIAERFQALYSRLARSQSRDPGQAALPATR
jgi:glycosyltransferase involved in cell wall biosynthesis